MFDEFNELTASQRVIFEWLTETDV